MSVGFAASSAASAALAVAAPIALTTGNFPELASFMAVYDQMRILRGVLHFSSAVSTAGTGSAFNSAGVLFDSTAGAPTRVAGPLEETFSSGPHILAAPPMVNIPALRKIPFHLPNPVAPIGTNLSPGRAWFILDSTNQPFVCAVNYYSDGIAGGGIQTFLYMVELECELKMRT
jgi:hypothetical protein